MSPCIPTSNSMDCQTSEKPHTTRHLRADGKRSGVATPGEERWMTLMPKTSRISHSQCFKHVLNRYINHIFKYQKLYQSYHIVQCSSAFWLLFNFQPWISMFCLTLPGLNWWSFLLFSAWSDAPPPGGWWCSRTEWRGRASLVQAMVAMVAQVLKKP